MASCVPSEGSNTLVSTAPAPESLDEMRPEEGLQPTSPQANAQLENSHENGTFSGGELGYDSFMSSQDYYMQFPANLNFDFLPYGDVAYGFDLGNPYTTHRPAVSDVAVQEASVRLRVTRSAIASYSLNKSAFVTPWKPQKIKTLDEYTNFTLPQEFSTQGLSPETSSWQPIVTYELRDSIMSMIPVACGGDRTIESIPRSGSFPPPAILSDILKLYSPEARPFSLTSFIHLPNFKSESSIPELVAAMIVKGGIEAPSPRVRRFCGALQQAIMHSFVMRVSLGLSCSTVHSLMPQISKNPVWMKELDFAQAYFLVQHVGFYSGSNLKIEVSKMCASPGATVIRQMAAQAKSAAEELDLMSLDTTASVEHMWRKWSKKESYHRIAYFAWILQAQSSLVFDVNMSIAPVEMSCPLPARRDWWDARSASEWWLTNPVTGRRHGALSLKDLLRDPSLLSMNRDYLDVHFAQLALLGGCWVLVREYRQFCALACEQNSLDTDLQTLRRDVLVRYLERVEMECKACGALSCEVEMFFQVVMMHAYVPFRDLETFAGRESDHANAKVSEEIICLWSQRKDAWHAVYHAGQVVRAAEAFAVGTLSDFYTIAFFHAVLLLWTYGVFQQDLRSDLHDEHRIDERLPWLCINAPCGTEHINFKTTGSGYIGLNVGGNDFVPLEHPASVVKCAMALLDSKCEHALPTMVNEEFARLLRDLHDDTIKNLYARPPQ
jgi:hypothetical protein